MHKLSTGEPSDPSPPDSRGFLNWLCDWRSYQISTAPSILRRGQSFRRVFVSPIWLWSSDRNLHNLDPDPAAPCPTSSHPKDLITEFLPGGICAPPPPFCKLFPHHPNKHRETKSKHIFERSSSFLK